MSTMGLRDNKRLVFLLVLFYVLISLTFRFFILVENHDIEVQSASSSIKELEIEERDKIRFSWEASGTVDFHLWGHPPWNPNSYEVLKEETGTSGKGSFEADYSGYVRFQFDNGNDSDVDVTLKIDHNWSGPGLAVFAADLMVVILLVAWVILDVFRLSFRKLRRTDFH
jgi:hypothetical protein